MWGSYGGRGRGVSQARFTDHKNDSNYHRHHHHYNYHHHFYLYTVKTSGKYTISQKKLQTIELTVIALTKMNDDHDNKISFTRIMIISMWSTPWSYSYTKKKGARGVWKHSKEATGKKKTRIANYRLPDHSWEITLTILPPRVVMARRNITLLSIKLLRRLYEPSHVFEVWRIAKSI